MVTRKLLKFPLPLNPQVGKFHIKGFLYALCRKSQTGSQDISVALIVEFHCRDKEGL